MKTALCLVICLVVGNNATAQQPEPASAQQALVDAERSFARMSAERGIRESFLAFIAEDGLLFRPSAVNGKKWMLESRTSGRQRIKRAESANRFCGFCSATAGVA